jgi:hypothetical protein
MRRLVGTTIAAFSALLASAAGAVADRGVALDLGGIDVVQSLTPGGGYALPPLGVRNPGDEVASYRLVVSHAERQQGKLIPEQWLRFEPAELTLPPGKTAKVQMRLSLPAGADPGDYEGLLAARIVEKGSGARVGAGAATKVSFSVEPATLLGGWWYRLRTAVSDNQPWAWLVPALLALTLLGLPAVSRLSSRGEWRA